MKHHCSFFLRVFAVAFLGMPSLGQAQLNETPISPGFWAFPSRKTATAQDIVAECRNHFEIRFTDGHFVGLRMHRMANGLVQRVIEDVGRCEFKRETQIDTCEMKLIHSDGSVMSGTTENRYLFDTNHTLKMTVTPKMITDSPADDAPFDAYPVRCPDDKMWAILNESSLPK
jgi:hypothetical protein